MTAPTIDAEAAGSTILGKTVSDLQSDVTVSTGKISGTLKYVTGYTEFSSDPALQEGNYLALKFDTEDWGDYTSVKVGLVPSAIGMDLVEVINDPDKNGVFKVTSPSQKFKMVATDGENTTTKILSLSGLTLESRT